MPAPALGQDTGSSRGMGWLWGALCPAVGRGRGAAAWGRASPVPGDFSPSSWMSVLALIETKSIFFFWKKRHCSGKRFPRVSSHVSAGRV